MSLNVNVSASDKQVWSGVADLLTCSTVNGQIGIHEGYEYPINLFNSGVVTVSSRSDYNVDTFTKIKVENGSISVRHDEVNIDAESAKIL
jgi:F0F1-type ATP synthase epsilon subunit